MSCIELKDIYKPWNTFCASVSFKAVHSPVIWGAQSQFLDMQHFRAGQPTTNVCIYKQGLCWRCPTAVWNLCSTSKVVKCSPYGWCQTHLSFLFHSYRSFNYPQCLVATITLIVSIYRSETNEHELKWGSNHLFSITHRSDQLSNDLVPWVAVAMALGEQKERKCGKYFQQLKNQVWGFVLGSVGSVVVPSWWLYPWSQLRSETVAREQQRSFILSETRR